MTNPKDGFFDCPTAAKSYEIKKADSAMTNPKGEALPIDVRAEFERWFRSRANWNDMMFDQLSDGRYVSVTTQNNWVRWQSATSESK